MRYLDKLINFVFSLAILVVSGLLILVLSGFLGYEVIDSFIREVILGSENATISCIVSIVVFFAALKTTAFLSKCPCKKTSNVMVDTTHGKVQIAQDTIETTAKNIAKSYDVVKDAQVKMVKTKCGIDIFMSLLVQSNVNIIDLSGKIQDEVKNTIESTIGAKVNNVDIKIKNVVENKKNKEIKIEPKIHIKEVNTESLQEEIQETISNENEQVIENLEQEVDSANEENQKEEE